MPTPRKQRIPSLRRHSPSKRAVVTLNGVDHYLGPWPDGVDDPPAEAQAAYNRHISEWLKNNRQPIPTSKDREREREAGRDPDRAPDTLSVAELIAAFMRHAEGYYRHPDGKTTSSLNEFVLSLRPLNHLYGGIAAKDFGPLKLKTVRELMVKGYGHPRHGPQPALCRRTVNARIQRLTQCFKWGAGEELLGVEVYQGLKAVPGLKRNRSAARESEPVLPVAVEHVNAAVPHLTLRLAGAARLQMLTGARPGEALSLRLADLDRGNPVWLYRPVGHKTAYKDKERTVAIGPKAKAVLREYIRIRCSLCGVEDRPPRIGSPDGCICGPCSDRMSEAGTCGPWQRIEAQAPDACLFSPTEAMKERDQDRRAKRKSKVQPSQVCRKKAKTKKTPGERYDTRAYARAVTKACEVAGVPHWHPNQLRHTHATEVRRRYGLEAAQVTLGHSNAAITQVYAERDLTLAVKVASEIG